MSDGGQRKQPVSADAADERPTGAPLFAPSEEELRLASQARASFFGTAPAAPPLDPVSEALDENGAGAASRWRSRGMHWSVSWSDLMMTMFILFAVLHIYKAANREFLAEELAPRLPDSAAEAIERSMPHAERLGGAFDDYQAPMGVFRSPTLGPLPVEPRQAVSPGGEPELEPGLYEEESAGAERAPVEAPSRPRPALPEGQIGSLTWVFDTSRRALADEDRNKIAQVDLAPDRAVRIVLTGDVLFDTGQADLRPAARQSLRTIAEILRRTPYVVNVVGHTDNVPMSSPRYPSNWELSTARACQVARFLIDEMGLPGDRFFVSGHSYFQPVKPNDTASNRAANRRVEIIITKDRPRGLSFAQQSSPAAALP